MNTKVEQGAREKGGSSRGKGETSRWTKGGAGGGGGRLTGDGGGTNL